MQTSFHSNEAFMSPEIIIKYSQLLLYRTLGYTGIRTYRTPRISVPRRNSSQYVLYTVWYSDIPDFLYTGL